MPTKTTAKPRTKQKLIVRDKDILGGTPVFAGSRVPVKNLFDYLQDNYSLEDFLYEFPSVERQQAKDVLEAANELMTAKP